jgi:hypothetical protein
MRSGCPINQTVRSFRPAYTFLNRLSFEMTASAVSIGGQDVRLRFGIQSLHPFAVSRRLPFTCQCSLAYGVGILRFDLCLTLCLGAVRITRSRLLLATANLGDFCFAPSPWAAAKLSKTVLLIQS